MMLEMVRRAQPKPASVERRLFDLSLGGIRLLDSMLETSGHPELAQLLREMLIDWRAYPSLSVCSQKDLKSYAKRLGQVRAGLHQSGHPGAAGLVDEVKREIEGWIRKAR
jgi:hypothetical protein